jgi:hypothetical protein
MENTITKTKRSRDDLTSKSEGTKKIISEENIPHRAFVVYLENKNTSLNKLNNQFYAERDLSGYYMYSITNTNTEK